MEESSCDCPRCRVKMFAARAGATLALGCRQCGGVMIDQRSALRMVQDRETLALANDTARSSSGVPVDVTRRGIPCPYCQRPMESAKLFGVDVDVCPTHGTWFDRGELGQIATEAVRVNAARVSGGVAVASGVTVGTLAADAAAAAEAQHRVDQVSRAQDLGALADDAAEVVAVGGEALANAEVVAEGVALAAEGAAAAAEGATAAAEVAVEGATAAAEAAGAAAEGIGAVFGAVLEVIGSIFSEL